MSFTRKWNHPQITGVLHGVYDRLQALQDVTAMLGLDYYGFYLELHSAYRPNLRLYDFDSAGDGSNQLPVWLLGESSDADGLVADPSRQYGYVNHYINRQIEAFMQQGIADYTYTPRQKLPRVLYWASFGYSFTL